MKGSGLGFEAAVSRGVIDASPADRIGLSLQQWSTGGHAIGYHGGSGRAAEKGAHGGVKYDDWRLPNVRELHSIVDYGQSYAAIHPAFSAVSWWYWSTTSAPFAAACSGGTTVTPPDFPAVGPERISAFTR